MNLYDCEGDDNNEDGDDSGDDGKRGVGVHQRVIWNIMANLF